jgi:hypothetical protein
MNVEELEEMLNNRIIEAYLYGYSVVEITRALKKTSVDFVHSLLRETGHIQVMARSEYRRKYDIDHRIVEACRKKGFSFGRWCLGWKFDPELAAADLKSAHEKASETVAHVALRRDFPEVFYSILGGNKPRRENKRSKAAALQPSLRIDWSIERKIFVATIPEYPMIEIRGSNWDESYFDTKTAYRLQENIMRLHKLIAVFEKE